MEDLDKQKFLQAIAGYDLLRLADALDGVWYNKQMAWHTMAVLDEIDKRVRDLRAAALLKGLE